MYTKAHRWWSITFYLGIAYKLNAETNDISYYPYVFIVVSAI